VITYDEHGGLYDHVPPPQTNVPNPGHIYFINLFFFFCLFIFFLDGKVAKNGFNFDRLGIRVPFVAISPWIEKGFLMHEPAESYFDHTSLAGTIRKMFNLTTPALTKREEWSATFENIFTRETPRTGYLTSLFNIVLFSFFLFLFPRLSNNNSYPPHQRARIQKVSSDGKSVSFSCHYRILVWKRYKEI